MYSISCRLEIAQLSSIHLIRIDQCTCISLSLPIFPSLQLSFSLAPWQFACLPGLPLHLLYFQTAFESLAQNVSVCNLFYHQQGNSSKDDKINLMFDKDQLNSSSPPPQECRSTTRATTSWSSIESSKIMKTISLFTQMIAKLNILQNVQVQVKARYEILFAFL